MLKRLVPSLCVLALLSGAAAARAQPHESEAPAPAIAAAAAPPCPGNPTALGTARTMMIDPAMPPVGLKTYPRTLALADHEVVLTFDDGPSSRTTPRVLDALEHECVRATFFVIGRNAKGGEALLRRELADGDTVGHHTWSHPAVTERGLSEAAAEADIAHGFVADDAAAYGAARSEPHVPFFRFPGFADSPPLLAWLMARHIDVFGADLWASDWLRQTPEEELKLLMARLDKAGRGIVLLHDIKAQTADMLPAFLAALKAGGYRVVAIAPGPGPTALRDAPPGWSSETEKTRSAVLRPTRVSRRPSEPPAMPAAPAAPSDDDGSPGGTLLPDAGEAGPTMP